MILLHNLQEMQAQDGLVELLLLIQDNKLINEIDILNIKKLILNKYEFFMFSSSLYY
ncbi:hypothetical protein GCM10008917_14820 [Paraclostridium tenue]|uniref:Uncharacterized protein n=1 Tax=Paraclostridium tenue TaxID=1737 RepID=A0ABN1M3V9_9FIRM